MKKYLIIIILMFVFGCNQKKTEVIHDNIRIISLSPHITEIIYKLNLDSNLVAVTEFCNYPPEAQKKEIIGGLLNPNIEKIVNLKPTHLFGQPSHTKLNQELSKFGLKILMMPNETISDIQKIISILSDTLGISDTGKELNKSIQNALDQIGNNQNIRKNGSAMLVIGREKGSVKNITVAGPNTYLNEIWELAGGINIFNDLKNKYATINIEEILIRNPDIIIEFNMNLPEGIAVTKSGGDWKILSRVSAVKRNNMFEIGGNYSLIPGPRVVRLAEDFLQIIQNISENK